MATKFKRKKIRSRDLIKVSTVRWLQKCNFAGKCYLNVGLTLRKYFVVNSVIHIEKIVRILYSNELGS